MSIILWWIRQIIFALTACFFLLFGIHILFLAYRLNDPSFFILTFFSSNLIILISGALLFIFIYRMIKTREKAAGDEVDL
jgi:hypothetical protein